MKFKFKIETENEKETIEATNAFSEFLEKVKEFENRENECCVEEVNEKEREIDKQMEDVINNFKEKVINKLKRTKDNKVIYYLRPEYGSYKKYYHNFTGLIKIWEYEYRSVYADFKLDMIETLNNMTITLYVDKSKVKSVKINGISPYEGGEEFENSFVWVNTISDIKSFDDFKLELEIDWNL